MHKKRRLLLIHVLIWLTIVSSVITHTFYDDDDSPLLFFIRLSIGILIFYFNYAILVPKILFKKKVLPYVFSVFGAILICSSIIAYIEYLDYFLPYLDVEDDGPGPMGGSFVVYTLFVVLGAVIRMYGEWNKNELDKREIENQKNISELKALKNQINPHFLFNSLNSICSLAIKKSDQTPEAIIMLSGLMRYMLYDIKGKYVPLSKEIDYIQNYVNLQKLRLGNKERVSLRVIGNINSQKIAPLILISFIENAFKYGVDIIEETSIFITIDIEDTEITFSCVNKINNKGKNNDGFGIGIENTQKRLALLYPDKHQLTIQKKNQMFIVNLYLKLNS